VCVSRRLLFLCVNVCAALVVPVGGCWLLVVVAVLCFIFAACCLLVGVCGAVLGVWCFVCVLFFVLFLVCGLLDLWCVGLVCEGGFVIA